jgi:DNA-binding transcriptional LysR family regulator
MVARKKFDVSDTLPELIKDRQASFDEGTADRVPRDGGGRTCLSRHRPAQSAISAHCILCRNCGWAAVCRDLRERNIDIAISGVTGAEAGADMVVENLFVDNYFVIVAGSQSPWVHRRKIELAELVNEPWTLLPSDSVAGDVVVDAFRARGLEPPRTTVVSPSLNLRNGLLATGRFLTVLPRFALMLPGKHPSLKALPISECTPQPSDLDAEESDAEPPRRDLH